MNKIIGLGVGVIVLNLENEILLLLRNDDAKKADSNMRYEGQYTLPAGKVKFQEEFEDAGIRKVKSETNLDVQDIEVICLINDYNEYAHYATIGLIAKEYSGNIDLGDTQEHVSYAWFKLDNLPKNLCASSKTIIDMYLKNKFYEKGDK